MNRYDELIEILPDKAKGTGVHEKPIILSLTRAETDILRHALQTMSKLTEARKKAYLGDKCEADNDAVCAYLFDENTQCDSTTLAMFNHYCFDKDQNRANADFFALAANLTREE